MMRLPRFALRSGLLVLLTLAPLAAHAVPSFDQQRFKPSPHALDLLSIRTSNIPVGYQPAGALLLNYSRASYGIAYIQETPRKVIESQVAVESNLTFDIAIAMAMWDHVSIGVVLPVVAQNSGESGPLVDTAGMESFGVGDLRIAPKGVILSNKNYPVGVAVELDLQLPTAMDNGLFGERGVVATPRIIVDANIQDKVLIAFNLGYRWRTAGVTQLRTTTQFGARNFLELGNDLAFGLGAQGWVWQKNLAVFGEFDFSTRDETFFGIGRLPENSRYFEWRLGLRYASKLGLGGVAAFSMAHDGGASFPDTWRLIAGLTYGKTGDEKPDDRDGDGLPDNADLCPDQPEDKDGYQDGDGCPDPDNDADGVADIADGCPMEAEDLDGFQDGDGCPDPDNDGDGIADTADTCPNQAEDLDRFADSDGCPDIDNDQDGILDARDRCPNDPETQNGCEDDDGCPEASKVCLTATNIVITDRVYFATGKATILPQSFPLLQDVAKVLKDNPQIRKVRVEGHTDNVGKPKNNLRLSKARAKSVLQFLVKAGIAKARLVDEGFGQTRPIATNDSEEGRATNRRVDFVILAQDDKPAPAASPRNP